MIERNIWNIEFQLDTSRGLNDFLTAYFGTDPSGRIQTEDELSQFSGENDRAKFAFLAAYIRDDYALALVTNATIDTANTDDSPPEVQVFSATDIALQMSYSRGFLENKKFRVGATAKMVYRIGRFGLMDFTELNENGILPVGEYGQEGLAFSFDIGTQYTWHMKTVDLSMGIAGLDLATPFGINLGLIGGQGRPPMLSGRAVAGVGFSSDHIIKSFTIKGNFDFVKSVSYTESSFLDLLHMGLEIKFPQFLSISGGLNQGYLTLGMAIKYWLLDVGFATYKENTGIYLGEKDASDRRYVFQFKLYF